MYEPLNKEHGYSNRTGRISIGFGQATAIQKCKVRDGIQENYTQSKQRNSACVNSAINPTNL